MYSRDYPNKTTQLERGQSLVEMTIGIVILTMIVMGILDIGRVYFLYLALEDAAGEAALYLSINPSCPTANECPNPRNALYRAKHSGSGYINWSTVNDADLFAVAWTGGGTPAQGDAFTVSLHYPYQVLTPVISAITGGAPIQLTANASSIVFIEPETP